MLIISHTVGYCLLSLLGLLAFITFSGIQHDCSTGYPCSVQKLFNENFMGIPVIGQYVNFYPMLNVSSVPILTITLRNNMMEVIPIKRWLRRYRCCHILLDVIIKTFLNINSIGFTKVSQRFLVIYNFNPCHHFCLF